MARSILGTVAVLGFGLFALVACAADDNAEGGEDFDTADPRTEDLRILPGSYSPKLADLISAADVNVKEGFGVPDERIPYPDTYWPFSAGESGVDGTDFRWQGPNTLSPVEKYATVVNAGNAAKVAQAKKWEHDHHGPGLGVKQNRTIASWEGHCPGWTGASMSNAPLKHPIFVKPDPSNVFAECSEADATAKKDGCIKFDIGDVNALMAEVYVDGNQPLVGWGCHTKNPTTDEFDRIKRNPERIQGENGAGCKGLNPGALLMVLGNRLKRDKLPFAINAQRPGISDQIWNQPVYRYVVNGYEEIDTQRAIELVAKNSKGTAPPSSYIWNPQAKGFAVVDISMWWTRELGPNTRFVSGKESTVKHRIKAVIELDRAIAGDAAARGKALIVGGEYLTDTAAAATNARDTFGPDRLTVPTFVWVSVDAGSDNLTEQQADNPNFQHHNPFIKPSLVKRLIALGQK